MISVHANHFKATVRLFRKCVFWLSGGELDETIETTIMSVQYEATVSSKSNTSPLTTFVML